MRILVHDLPASPFKNIGSDLKMIGASGKAAPCQGCFGCWTKNAGYCVYQDALQHSGALAGKSEQIVVVSQICYGGYSPAVKRFFDRAISDSSPFLTYRQGKTYHINRYPTKRRLMVYFYGACTEFERETAREYVERQAVNLGAQAHEVVFAACAEELGAYEI